MSFSSFSSFFTLVTHGTGGIVVAGDAGGNSKVWEQPGSRTREKRSDDGILVSSASLLTAGDCAIGDSAVARDDGGNESASSSGEVEANQ